MHTGILLAVEAEDKADAVESVSQFNEHNAHWSDWNEHGGRWANVIPDGVISYKENPELFMETLTKFQDYTKEELNRLVNELGHITLRDLALEPKYDFGNFKGEYANEEEKNKALTDSLARYRANKLMKLLNGEFDSDTHFYDTREYTMRDTYLLERIKENPENQFIVVWDYHH